MFFLFLVSTKYNCDLLRSSFKAIAYILEDHAELTPSANKTVLRHLIQMRFLIKVNRDVYGFFPPAADCFMSDLKSEIKRVHSKVYAVYDKKHRSCKKRAPLHL